MVLWKTGIKFSSPIHPAGLYEKCDVVFLRVDYLKNDFHFLIEDEKLEAKYMGIGVGRLPLNTRLMYFDLLDIQVDE